MCRYLSSWREFTGKVTVFFHQLPPDEGVKLLVQRFRLIPKSCNIGFKIGIFIPWAPVSAIVIVTWRIYKLVNPKNNLKEKYLKIILNIKKNTCPKHYYKDRKCTMNENPSVRIESAGSKPPAAITTRWKTEVLFRIARLYVGSKIVCFYESDHAFKTIWRHPCLCHLIKIKGYFLKPGMPVFIIVINTSCSGIFYRIYGWQKFLYTALAPNGTLALFESFAGYISCNKRPHNRYLFLQQISLPSLPEELKNTDNKLRQNKIENTVS